MKNDENHYQHSKRAQAPPTLGFGGQAVKTSSGVGVNLTDKAGNLLYFVLVPDWQILLLLDENWSEAEIMNSYEINKL